MTATGHTCGLDEAHQTLLAAATINRAQLDRWAAAAAASHRHCDTPSVAAHADELHSHLIRGNVTLAAQQADWSDDTIAWPWTRTRDIAWLIGQHLYTAARRAVTSAADAIDYINTMIWSDGRDPEPTAILCAWPDLDLNIQLDQIIHNSAIIADFPALLDKIPAAAAIRARFDELDPELASFYAAHHTPAGGPDPIAQTLRPAVYGNPDNDPGREPVDRTLDWIAGGDPETRRTAQALWGDWERSISELAAAARSISHTTHSA